MRHSVHANPGSHYSYPDQAWWPLFSHLDEAFLLKALARNRSPRISSWALGKLFLNGDLRLGSLLPRFWSARWASIISDGNSSRFDRLYVGFVSSSRGIRMWYFYYSDIIFHQSCIVAHAIFVKPFSIILDICPLLLLSLTSFMSHIFLTQNSV